MRVPQRTPVHPSRRGGSPRVVVVNRPPLRGLRRRASRRAAGAARPRRRRPASGGDRRWWRTCGTRTCWRPSPRPRRTCRCTRFAVHIQPVHLRPHRRRSVGRRKGSGSASAADARCASGRRLRPPCRTRRGSVCRGRRRKGNLTGLRGPSGRRTGRRGGRRVRPCQPPLRARPVGSSRPSGRGADGVEAAGPGGTRSSVAGAQPSPAPEPGHPRPRPARAHSQSPAQAFTSRRRSSPGYGPGRTASSGQARTSGKSSAPTRNLDTCPGAGATPDAAARDASTSRVPGRPGSTGRRTLHTSPTAGPRPAFASRLTRPPDSLPCPGRVYSPPWNVSIS